MRNGQSESGLPGLLIGPVAAKRIFPAPSSRHLQESSLLAPGVLAQEEEVDSNVKLAVQGVVKRTQRRLVRQALCSPKHVTRVYLCCKGSKAAASFDCWQPPSSNSRAVVVAELWCRDVCMRKEHQLSGPDVAMRAMTH